MISRRLSGRRHGGAMAFIFACFAFQAMLAQDPPPIEVAGDLYVDLDAADPSAGTEVWFSQGVFTEFEERGDACLTDHEGAPGVCFNSGVTPLDAYESVELVPDTLVDANSTRSIEVWTFNQDLAGEETLVAWGRRGGPDGTNMSFNYGTNVYYSAVGHWGWPFWDLGWGAVPPAGRWHHLVYTYDGGTTRVYADGFISNAEYLGPGQINTHDGSKIALAAQYLPNGIQLDPGGIRGVLSLGKVRIHSDTLTPEQILKNYYLERPRFPLPEEAPVFVNPPLGDEDFVQAAASTYTYQLRVEGFPVPAFQVLEPAGGTVSAQGLISFTLPDPRPDSFRVRVSAANPAGTSEASWQVTVLRGTGISAAGELFVDLDSRDATAGTAAWANPGTLSDFTEVGDPQVAVFDGAPGVTFNLGATMDAYQSVEDAPVGLVGIDPTRSIEVWALNPTVEAEEALVSWGQRGGPDGTNMAFGFGSHPWFGAVTHWNQSHQDLGWLPNLPPANQWVHLAYTFDGQNTRVYLNGAEAAWEGLGPNQINTFELSKITVGAQVAPGGLGPDFNMPITTGRLAIGRVRVHDGVLTPAQIRNNFQVERGLYPAPPSAAFTVTPESGTEPLQVSVDGTSSTSPNGAVTQFSWDFGDGETGTGATTTHTFQRSGRFTITLTITDDKGADASVTRLVSVDFRSAPIPPWTAEDITDAPLLVKGGSRPGAGGCIDLQAGGRDIGRGADQFHFIYQGLSGNASVTARVSAAEMPQGAKVGVMLRENNTPGSRHASIFLQSTGAGRYTFVRRETANAFPRPAVNSTDSFTLPNAWVRMERQGGELIGSFSSDGQAWTVLGRVTMAVPFTDQVLGGIAATAEDLTGNYDILKATVCDAQVTGAAPPPSVPAGLAAIGGSGRVDLDWNNNPEGDLAGYHVYRGPEGGPLDKITAAPVAASAYADTAVVNGTRYCYQVTAVGPGGESGRSGQACVTPVAGKLLRRGDLNTDQAINLTDAINLLGALFLGSPELITCRDAADVDDSGNLNLTDAIYLLSYSFQGGDEPPAPGPKICGLDTTADSPLPPVNGELGCLSEVVCVSRP